MIRLLRFLRGYVIFTVTGSYPERLVNICIFNGVNVWGIKSKEGVVYCCAMAANYKAIRRLSHKTSAKIRIKRKCGLPFILKRNSKRKGLLIGFCLMLAILKVLSMFVWVIDFKGFESFSTSYAKEIMSQVGISEGVYSGFDNIKNMQTKAMMMLENVSWLSINVDGSYAEINMSESVPKGEVSDNQKPANIKAECDAQILRVDAYGGVPSVRSGDAVVKGNLLISGIAENENGGIALMRADGVVWASTKYSETISIQKAQTKIEYGEPETRYACRLFNILIPLTYKCNSQGRNIYLADEQRASFNGNNASLSLITENIYPYRANQYNIDETTAEEQFKTKVMLNELFKYNDKKIVSRNIEKSADSNKISYEIFYECEEDIGYSDEIITEDNFRIDNDSLESTDTDSDTPQQ